MTMKSSTVTLTIIDTAGKNHTVNVSRETPLYELHGVLGDVAKGKFIKCVLTGKGCQ